MHFQNRKFQPCCQLRNKTSGINASHPAYARVRSLRITPEWIFDLKLSFCYFRNSTDHIFASFYCIPAIFVTVPCGKSSSCRLKFLYAAATTMGLVCLAHIWNNEAQAPGKTGSLFFRKSIQELDHSLFRKEKPAWQIIE